MNEQFPVLGVNMHATPTEEGHNPEAVLQAVQEIINEYEDGNHFDNVPFSHVLTSLMMEVFAPGFIIIASPNTMTTEDGIELPADCGFIINARTNMTATTVGHFLGVLSDLIQDSSDQGLVDLTDIYGDEEE